MSLTAKTGRVACWIMNVSLALAAMGAILSESPTQQHRLLKAGTIAVLVLFNGWLWSMQPAAKPSA